MSAISSEMTAVSEFKERVRGVAVSEIVEGVHSGDSPVHCKMLDLNDQRIGDVGISELCSVLKFFTALEELHLRMNDISSGGVKVLCASLSVCERLRRLYLHDNSIDDIGAGYIAEVILKTELETLWISNNSIGRDGVRILLLSAANSTTLRELRIYRNIGVSAAVADIVEILPHCRTLETVVLGWDTTELSDGVRQRIRTVMSQCSSQLKVRFAWREGGSNVVCGATELDCALLETIHDSATFHREFLSAMQRHGSIRVYRSRVSLVGDSQVGKTWTAKSLRGEPNFHPHTPEQRKMERTAAADHSVLYIGDFTVGGVDLWPQGSSKGATDIADHMSALDIISESGAPSTRASSVFGNGARNDFAAQTSERSLCRVHDKVRNFRLPQCICDKHGIDAENSVCYLTLWDFGGQLMYHSWYQFFFAPGMIPCVVFDLEKLLSGGEGGVNSPMVDRIVQYAQQSVHFGGPDCRVLLVGTKADSAVRLLAERIPTAGGPASESHSNLSAVTSATSSTTDIGSHTATQRGRAEAKAYEIIVAASPLPLKNRYYEFHYVDDDFDAASDVLISDETRGHLCALENYRSMTDIGVRTLWNSLVGECVRARTLDEDGRGSDRLPSSTPSAGGERSTGEHDAGGISTVREYLRNNMLPKHWYAFEMALRSDTEFKLLDWCSVRHLAKFAKEYHRDIKSDMEFVVMLSSMASAGDIILTSTVPWRDMEELHVVPEAFMKSLVIIRPQRLIEVGRTLLPRPYETYDEYTSRLIASFPNISDLAVLVDRLWRRGIVGSQLLSAVLAGTTNMSQRQLAAFIDLFEHRQILCRIDADDAGVKKGQWFVPSMVVFHAEHPSPGIGTAVREKRDSHIQIRLSFNWVPPGYPLLVVGALLQGVSTEPTFSLCHESGHIQFAVTYRGSARWVYIDLPRGAGSNEIVVWTPLKLTAKTQHLVQRFLTRLLEAACTACRRLRVEPLLEAPFATVERGLILSVTIPAVPAKENSEPVPLHMVNLLELCRGGTDLSDECDTTATNKVYHKAISDVTGMSICEDLLMGLEE